MPLFLIYKLHPSLAAGRKYANIVATMRKRIGHWWASRTSNPVCGVRSLAGGFDSHALPPFSLRSFISLLSAALSCHTSHQKLHADSFVAACRAPRENLVSPACQLTPKDLIQITKPDTLPESAILHPDYTVSQYPISAPEPLHFQLWPCVPSRKYSNQPGIPGILSP